MVNPRPYGLLVKGEEPTESDLIFIESLVRHLTNIKSTSELESLRLVITLPNDGYVIVQDMGGNLRVIVNKESLHESIYKNDGIAKLYVPMLYSGVILKAIVQQGEGVKMRITEQTRRRLSQYGSINNFSNEYELQRFVIEYHQDMQEFVPRELTQLIHTQYSKQRPTWYSGAMAEVMQIVGGYGKQLLSELPDNPIEQATLQIPKKYLERIIDELDDLRLPGYKGIPNQDGQFQYDFRFYKTDGVGFDELNKPWLLRITTNGVWAMPLPMIPATTTQAFREFMEEVGDDEILKILDRFGGLPSGETFPTGKEFEPWRRAGVIIKICDVGDFYQNLPYTAACGWSLNSRATEGFNTCTTWDYDSGFCHGLAYKLKINLKAAANQGNKQRVDLSGEDAQLIGNYLSQLLPMLKGDSATTLAILYKLRSVDKELILDQAIQHQNSLSQLDINDLNYWDNLEVEPIAKHSGSVSKVGDGILYSTNDPMFQPQIKFPDTALVGCMSFNFSATKPVTALPLCDTIMYGYYIGDSLKVVKYFADYRSYKKQTISNFEANMIVGSWEQISTTSNNSINGNFYTSDFDDREDLAPSTTRTTIVGRDAGYDIKPNFSFISLGSMSGELWRYRYYTHLTKIETTESLSLQLSICIPYFNRNAILHGNKRFLSGMRYQESLRLNKIKDPHTYLYWTYHSAFAWHSPLNKQLGKPYPTNGNPVWVEIEEYNPTEISDFADQGSWIPSLPFDYRTLIHPDSNEWLHSGGGGAPKVDQYDTYSTGPSESSGSLNVSIGSYVQNVFKTTPHENYFVMSPSNNGEIFYRDGCKVVFGDAEYANISEYGADNKRKFWGFTRLVNHFSAHHFIGVINE